MILENLVKGGKYCIILLHLASTDTHCIGP